MNEASYTAWDDNLYEWPPPDGWYQADDGKWWPQGYGPTGDKPDGTNGDGSDALLYEIERTSIFPAGGSQLIGGSSEDRLQAESERPTYDELPNIDDVFGGPAKPAEAETEPLETIATSPVDDELPHLDLGLDDAADNAGVIEIDQADLEAAGLQLDDARREEAAADLDEILADDLAVDPLIDDEFADALGTDGSESAEWSAPGLDGADLDDAVSGDGFDIEEPDHGAAIEEIDRNESADAGFDHVADEVVVDGDGDGDEVVVDDDDAVVDDEDGEVAVGHGQVAAIDDEVVVDDDGDEVVVGHDQLVAIDDEHGEEALVVDDRSVAQVGDDLAGGDGLGGGGLDDDGDAVVDVGDDVAVDGLAAEHVDDDGHDLDAIDGDDDQIHDDQIHDETASPADAVATVSGFHLGELPDETEFAPDYDSAELDSDFERADLHGTDMDHSDGDRSDDHGDLDTGDDDYDRDGEEANYAHAESDTGRERTIWPMVAAVAVVVAVMFVILAFVLFGRDDAPAGFDAQAALAVQGEGSLSQPYPAGSGAIVYYPVADSDDERRWVIQIVEPVSDRTEQLVADRGAAAPGAGSVLAATTVRITYRDGPVPGPAGDLKMTSIGSSLVLFNSADRCQGLTEQLDQNVGLEPGQAIEGELCWEIPEGDLADLKLVIEAGPVEGTVFVDLG
ncbi:MAG: hypothetical protein ACR2QO_02600 [Acidimicrobiales bacterium]